jgi:hypothetical protein
MFRSVQKPSASEGDVSYCHMPSSSKTYYGAPYPKKRCLFFQKKKMKSDFIAHISVSRRIFTGANKPSNMVFFTVQPVCAVARWKGRIKLSSLRSHDQPRVVTRSACDGGGGGRGGDTKGRLRSMRKRIRRGKGASLSSCSSTRDTSAVYSSSSSATIPTRIIARTETNEPALLARSLLVGLGTWDVDC